MLADAFGIEIDWFVTAPHHGKGLVDAIAGKDKYDLMNGFIRGMDKATRNELFEKISQATACREYLSRENRSKGDTKHSTKKPSDGKHTLSERECVVTDYGVAGMPAKNCHFEIRTSQWAKAAKPQWAIDKKPKGGKWWTTKNGQK